jgi:hypothetical protein
LDYYNVEPIVVFLLFGELTFFCPILLAIIDRFGNPSIHFMSKHHTHSYFIRRLYRLELGERNHRTPSALLLRHLLRNNSSNNNSRSNKSNSIPMRVPMHRVADPTTIPSNDNMVLPVLPLVEEEDAQVVEDGAEDVAITMPTTIPVMQIIIRIKTLSTWNY